MPPGPTTALHARRVLPMIRSRTMADDDLRTLFVRMDDVLDAMDTRGTRSPRFFLDTATGEISLSLAAAGDGDAIDANGHCLERIPTRDPRDEIAAMNSFVATVDEPDVRAPLERALRGRAAAQRFRDALAVYPDLATAWQRHQREVLLQQALAWFQRLGIAPQYELRPLRPLRRFGEGQRAAEAGQVGLFDLLLLGAPAGKPRLSAGRVDRRIRAGDPEQARAIFLTIARQLCEQHGQPWRRRFFENADRHQADRFTLTIDGDTVTLSVAVPHAIWSAFQR